jgi:hypothetical protein
LDTRADSNTHYVSRFAPPSNVVSTFLSPGTLIETEDSAAAQEVPWFPYVYDSTGTGTNLDVYSALVDLLSDTGDIDAGNATYRLESMMQGTADTCYMWLQFFQSDGTTTVGSRVSSTAKTHAKKGENVVLTGTIPVNARKVQLGWNTSDGSSNSRFDARDMMLLEVAPTITGVTPSPSSPVVNTIVIL